jgi:hypothetical protein
MQDYRELSKQRYLQQKQKENDDKDAFEKNQIAIKTKHEQDFETFYECLEKWDAIHPSSITDIEVIYSLFSIVLPLAKQLGLFFHIEKRIVGLVESLNDTLKTQTLSIEEVRPFYEIMNSMISEAELDIPIEIMDTQRDEEIANEIANELLINELIDLDLFENENIEQNVEAIDTIINRINNMEMDEKYEDEVEQNVEAIDTIINRINNMEMDEKYEDEVDEKKEENIDDDKPICSYTSRKGLTLTKLKDIARLSSLPLHGNKEDLCKRLAKYNLVRIV